jgi:hypothetical protein
MGVDTGLLRRGAGRNAQGFPLPAPAAPEVTSFVTLEEISRHVQKCIEAIPVRQLAENAVKDALDRMRGRI